MRTTVEFDADTARAIEEFRREQGVGVSEAVNALIRRGLIPASAGPPFRQRTTRLGLRVDVSNIGDATETLGGATSR